MASCIITGHLFAALRGTAEFRSSDLALLMGEEIRRQHSKEEETTLGEAQTTTSKPDARQLGKIQRTRS